MSYLKHAIIFGLGTAVGAGVCYVIMKKQREELEMSYEGMKNHVSKLGTEKREKEATYAKLREDNALLKARKEELEEEVEAKCSLIKAYENREAYYADNSGFYGESDGANGEEPYEEDQDPYYDDRYEGIEVIDRDPNARCRFIKEVEFSFDTDYEKNELSVWLDGIISDENGYEVENPESLLGTDEITDGMWAMADDYGYIYIRNPRIGQDYALRREKRRYVDIFEQRPVL